MGIRGINTQQIPRHSYPLPHPRMPSSTGVDNSLRYPTSIHRVLSFPESALFTPRCGCFPSNTQQRAYIRSISLVHRLWVEGGKPSDKSVEELLTFTYLPQGLPTLPPTIIIIGYIERDYLFSLSTILILRRGDKWSEEDEEVESGTTAERLPLPFRPSSGGLHRPRNCHASN